MILSCSISVPEVDKWTLDDTDFGADVVARSLLLDETIE